MNIFDKWNSAVDGKKLAAEVNELNSNEKEYVEVPYGDYEVSITKIGLKECQSEANFGMPMLSIQFKILEGEYKDSYIFMNQLVHKPYGLHVANQFLRDLESSLTIDFDGNYGHYNDLLAKIFKEINEYKLEYLLEYYQNKHGFKQYHIKNVYDTVAEGLPF